MARWVNIADPGDIVAVPIGGIPRGFDGIDPADDHTYAIGAFDFHRVAGYLSHRAFGDVIARVI
ncbi:hypothetical protein GCM10023205_70930 [Yinghuangia aomiensis]|uniref:Uncharacterized protein n=1 Tax=Yinghuangia aomiensis TaxID=676205 RepID=A0ABP9I7J6_9ACTN